MENAVISRAIALVEMATERSVTLRVGGSVGVILHCPRSQRLMKDCHVAVGDIDLYALSAERSAINSLLEVEGFSDNDQVATAVPYIKRQIFTGNIGGKTVTCDVTFDEAVFVHRINLKERLFSDYPTLSVTDLLMLKLQMKRRALKDVVHQAMLLACHDILCSEGDNINESVIARRIRNDFRCYSSFIESLEQMIVWCETEGVRLGDMGALIISRSEHLANSLRTIDKGLLWSLQRCLDWARPAIPEPEEIHTL